MIIAIGADHRGFAYKELIKKSIQHIDNITIGWLDKGAYNIERSDYPLYAQAVCQEILKNNAQLGVLICGTGAGMAIAANRFKSIYAALVWDIELSKLARSHDNANILVLPSDYITGHEAIDMVTMWLKTTFLTGRYEKRIEMIDTFSSD